MRVLLSTAYWPNLEYMYYVLNASEVCIEQHEHYQKQSFRNRTVILSANGLLQLSIPVLKKADKEFSKDIEICYKENWQNKHWRAITSAYKNSPYFEYFETEINALYNKPYANLLDYNLAQLKTVLQILKHKKQIELSSAYNKQPNADIDLRDQIHPKKNSESNAFFNAGILSVPYYQTFENKFPFQANLSVLDILFNKGIETLDYLKPS